MSNATDNPSVEVLKAGGSGVFTNYIYKAIPLAFDESMSYYETLAGLRDYLEETVIPTVNNNADAVAELQRLYEELNAYVDNYFSNLDVQEEINNKLDELVEDGTLTRLIGEYVQPLIDDQNEEIAEFKTSVNEQIAEQNAQIQAVASGSPLVASSVSGMTDTTRVYVNTSDGYWYYYNGTQWTQGGVYQAAEDSDTVDLLQIDMNHITDAKNYNRNSTGYVHTSTAMNASNGRINTGDVYEAYTALYFIPVTYGDIIKFSGASGANMGNIVGYSKENASSFVSTLLTKTENTILDNEEVIITNRNIHYIGVTYRTRENVPYSLNVKKNPLTYTLENKEDIETLTPIVDANQKSVASLLGNTPTLIKDAQVNGTVPEVTSWELGGIDTSTGENIVSNSFVRTADFIEVPFNTTHMIVNLLTEYVSTPASTIRCYKYRANHDFISMTAVPSEGLNITNAVKYIKIVLVGTNLQSAKDSVVTFTPIADTNIVPTIDELNDPHYIKNTLAQVAMGHCTEWQKPNTSLPILKLLHFTDIHGNEKNLKRIIEFKNEYSDYIDDAICTGDMVTSHYEDGMTFWNNANANNVMMGLGNHDVVTLEDYEGNVVHGNDTFISLKRCYDAYIAPYVANWNVVQPTGVNDSTSPYYAACYYYKDYPTYGIRLIMLDNLHWDNNQSTWLTSVLEDARTNNLAVIATQHFPVGETTSINTTFCVPKPYERYTPNTAGGVSNISTFINNGGEFICWLTGHYHQDGVGRLVADNRQLDINMDLASYYNTTESRILLNEKSMDCFQILSFDTTDKYIRMYRIGRDMDRYLQKKSVFCYDYANHKLIYNG